MTLVGTIIEEAMRESGLITELQHPTPTQNARALERLQSLVSGVYGYDVGEKLSDWPVGTVGLHEHTSWSELDWKYPIQNSRLVLAHATPQIVYLPDDPENGARIQLIDLRGALATYPVTLNANGRLIEGQPVLVLNTANLNCKWMFNADTSDWALVEGLTAVSEMPFPIEYDDYFIIKLAARLDPRYGRSLSELSVARISELQERLSADYRQTRPMPAPLAVRRNTERNSRVYDGVGRRGRWGWM